VAERSSDTAFVRTQAVLYMHTVRSDESGVAAAAFPPQFMTLLDSPHGQVGFYGHGFIKYVIKQT
jgi:hypothetical protein